MANVHPWFANVSITEPAGWTESFFENTDVALAKELSNNLELSIAETGWLCSLYRCLSWCRESNGPLTASEANLEVSLLCTLPLGSTIVWSISDLFPHRCSSTLLSVRPTPMTFFWCKQTLFVLCWNLIPVILVLQWNLERWRIRRSRSVLYLCLQIVWVLIVLFFSLS